MSPKGHKKIGSITEFANRQPTKLAREALVDISIFVALAMPALL